MDYHKKLGKKTPITLETADFYIHEFWPNNEKVPVDDGLTNYIVRTDAGTMLVGYRWFDHKSGEHFIRRATSLNTVRWFD